MSGYQIIEPTAGSTDWTDASVLFNIALVGIIPLSLTNWDTTGIPAIAEGSKIEVAGSVYTFASTESIGGTASTSNINYIMVTTSSSSITASYTTNAPVWVASKHGWYDSSTGAKRYVGGCGINKHMKWIYDKGHDNNFNKTLEIGDWNMDSLTVVSIDHGLGAQYNNIRSIEAIIRNDTDTMSHMIDEVDNGADPNLIRGGIHEIDENGFDILRRAGQTIFDSIDFNATSYNRGFVTIWYGV